MVGLPTARPGIRAMSACDSGHQPRRQPIRVIPEKMLLLILFVDSTLHVLPIWRLARAATKRYRHMTEQKPQRDEDFYSRRLFVIWVIVCVLLALGSLYLLRALRDRSQLEDCFMQG